MFAGIPSLTHEQQQQAVEEIHRLISEGMSSGEAIARVAEALRQGHQGERVVARFEDDEDDSGPQY